MSVAEKLNPHFAEMFAGHVERAEGEVMVVRYDAASLRARRAPSCLLVPEAGDRVLVATTGEGRAYVLAVLERDEETEQRWVSEGDVSIQSTTGRVDVRGQAGASIASPGEVAVYAGTFDLKSRIAKLAVAKLSLLGEEALAEVTRSRLVASTIETVAELVSQTASRVARVVTEIDHLRAGTIDMAAEKALLVHAENTMVTAKDLVKLDGEAVQLG